MSQVKSEAGIQALVWTRDQIRFAQFYNKGNFKGLGLHKVNLICPAETLEVLEEMIAEYESGDPPLTVDDLNAVLQFRQRVTELYEDGSSVDQITEDIECSKEAVHKVLMQQRLFHYEPGQLNQSWRSYKSFIDLGTATPVSAAVEIRSRLGEKFARQLSKELFKLCEVC